MLQNEAPAFLLELPDPESDAIGTLEFHARLDEAWAVCDRFDLQTEIWRGRILRAATGSAAAAKTAARTSCSGCGNGRSARPGPTP
jgi:hypothetical protein